MNKNRKREKKRSKSSNGCLGRLVYYGVIGETKRLINSPLNFQVFKAIQTSCMDLLRALEKYQDKLCSKLFFLLNTRHGFLLSSRGGKIMHFVNTQLYFSNFIRVID